MSSNVIICTVLSSNSDGIYPLITTINGLVYSLFDCTVHYSHYVSSGVALSCSRTGVV
jgi:hypothetical protein